MIIVFDTYLLSEYLVHLRVENLLICYLTCGSYKKENNYVLPSACLSVFVIKYLYFLKRKEAKIFMTGSKRENYNKKNYELLLKC